MVAPILKEWFVAMSIVIPQISVGIMFAFPSCLVPGLVENRANLATTKENALWASAAQAICGASSFFIVSPMMQYYGRKTCNIFIHSFSIIGCITIALAYDITTLIIGRCLQGLAYAGLIVATVLLAEYTHPKRRGMFVAFKLIFFFTGITLLHGLSYLFTWRQLAWMTTAPPALGVIFTLAWPESPAWLAYKGQFSECVEAFEWLRGKSEESTREVTELIVAQQKIQAVIRRNSFFRRFVTAMSTKDFLMPLVIAVFMVILVQTSGLGYLVAYVIEIMLEMTGGDQSKAFYYTMGFDLMKIIAMFVYMALERLFRRRTLMLGGGGVSAVILLGICLMEYFKDLQMMNNCWTGPSALIIFSFLCNVTVFPVVLLMKGEIFPLEYRGLGVAMLGICDASIASIATKVTPNLLLWVKSYGTFSIYLVFVVGSLITLYFILPETKDRTLQDIEKEFIDINKYDEKERQVVKLLIKNRKTIEEQ